MRFLDFINEQEILNLNEKRSKYDYVILHDTFTSAVGEARRIAELKGYEIDEDDWADQITFGPGKPGRGKTFKASLGLIKDNKDKREALHIQVYNKETERNTYELNTYIM